MNLEFYKNRINELLNEMEELVTEDKIYKIRIDDLDYNDRFRVIKESNINVKKIEVEKLKSYEKYYDVKLPDLLYHMLTKIGHSELLAHNFLNNEELIEPTIYMSSDFYKECIKNGASQKLVDEFDQFYDWNNNSFKNKILQNTYTYLGRNSNKLLSKLLYTGHGHCGGGEYILLNGNKNIKAYMIVADGEWATKEFEYMDKTWWQLSFGTFNEYFNDFVIKNLESKIKYTIKLN